MSWSDSARKAGTETREGEPVATITQAGTAWQRLREDGGDVVIEPLDEDRFTLPIDDVIRACRYQEKAGAFQKQIGLLLRRLHTWLHERTDVIDRALLSVEADGLTLAVVRKDKAFNPDFEDALSALDLEIANDDTFDQIRMRTMALPYSSDATVSGFLRCLLTWRGAASPTGR